MDTTIKQKQLEKAMPKYNLLTANAFIVGLIILLANDLYFKYSFPSTLTGKLSDFAGLFIFPYFLCVFIPKPKIVYYLTALLFIFWKMELSQPVIDFFAKLTNLGFHRTVDITDLIALTILPLSFRYFKLQNEKRERNRFVFSTVICIVSIFSFCATSQPRQAFNANIKVDKTFILPMDKETFFEQLWFGNCQYCKPLPENLTDSLFYLYFYIHDGWVEVTAVAKIESLGDDNTVIQLDSIVKYDINGSLFSGIKQSNIDSCNNLKASDFENLFELNFINILLQKKRKSHELRFSNINSQRIF